MALSLGGGWVSPWHLVLISLCKITLADFAPRRGSEVLWRLSGVKGKEERGVIVKWRQSFSFARRTDGGDGYNMNVLNATEKDT